MQRKKKLTSGILALAITLAVIAARSLMLSVNAEADGSLSVLNYVVIGVIVLVTAVLAVMTLSSDLCEVRGRSSSLLGFFTELAGVAVLFENFSYGYQWFVHDQAPPPSAFIVNFADKITLIGTLVFGILGGAFLVSIGTAWFRSKYSVTGVYAVWALTPVLWMWMRLARYEISYASAVTLGKSFYDFVMLIFSMLFLFSFASYVSGVRRKSGKRLLFYALCTMLLCGSNAVVRYIVGFAQGVEDYAVGHLAGMSDLALGLMAGAVAFSQIFGKQMQTEEIVGAEEVAEAVESTEISAVSEIAEVSISEEMPEADLPEE